MHFIDLPAQQKRVRSQILNRIESIFDHGAYIMGPEVHELERELEKFCGAKHAISCSNGTDALMLALMALEVKAGQAILCPSFTFAATAEVIPCMGALPIFVDIDPDTYNMDVNSLELGIKQAKQQGLDLVGIIAVDLFGLPADYNKISQLADSHGLWLIADSAQGFGAVYKGKKTGTIGDITTTSFFPAKPLGCYGDGGALFTNKTELVEVIKSYRVHGQGENKYENIRIGMNGRLDSIQAAVLLEKLKIYPDEIIARQKIASYYNSNLSSKIKIPKTPDGYESVWAQYTIVLPQNTNREELQKQLKESNIPTAVYYPIPLHKQKAYKKFPSASESLPVTEDLSKRVLSLPMHPYLNENDQRKIITTINSLIK